MNESAFAATLAISPCLIVTLARGKFKAFPRKFENGAEVTHKAIAKTTRTTERNFSLVFCSSFTSCFPAGTGWFAFGLLFEEHLTGLIFLIYSLSSPVAPVQRCQSAVFQHRASSPTPIIMARVLAASWSDLLCLICIRNCQFRRMTCKYRSRSWILCCRCTARCALLVSSFVCRLSPSQA